MKPGCLVRNLELIDERDASRREVEELRGQVERHLRAVMLGIEENARLRALLKGALVPCPVCDTTGQVEGCYDVMRDEQITECSRCSGMGYVPVKVEP